MISELYNALEEAGLSGEKVKTAAIAVAHHNFDISNMKADLMLLKWLVGFNLAMTAVILWRIFT